MLPRSRIVPIAALAAAALAGCDGSSLSATPSGSITIGGPTSQLRPVLAEVPDQLAAADPRLPGFDGWPLAFDARFHDPARHSCEVVIARGTTTLRTLPATLDASRCSATWDGRDTAGATVRPGALVATARLLAGTDERARATSALEVVRLGIDRITIAAESGARASLLYRRTGGLEDGWYEVSASHTVWQLAPDRGEAGASALELADTTSRALPAIHADVLSAPLDPRAPDGVEHDTFSLPTAWIAGSELRTTARLTSSLPGQPAGGDPIDVEVRVVAPEGNGIEGADAFADGASITLVSDGSPVPAVGRYDLAWSFGFEARRAGGEWQPIPGAFPVALRLYGLVAMPTFDSSAVPHRAWVDVVDRVTGWVAGSAADEATVSARIVAGVYQTLGLRYDTARGASFYTDYSSGFSGAIFYQQEFEERDFGNVLNCTDAASIVSAYGNMMGIDLRYHILTNRRGVDLGFDLNFIQAIGMPAFDDTPFDSGRGGFRYHAIVGSRDGRTWDATLAVDGDGAPASAPHVQLLVQGMDPTAYLVALSSQSSEIRTDLDEKVRIQ